MFLTIPGVVPYSFLTKRAAHLCLLSINGPHLFLNYFVGPMGNIHIQSEVLLKQDRLSLKHFLGKSYLDLLSAEEVKLLSCHLIMM